jgi:hypothetical protein
MALRAHAACCAAARAPPLRANAATTAAAAVTPLAPPRAPRRRRRAVAAVPARAALTPRGVAAAEMPAAAAAGGATAAPSPLDALSSSFSALLSVTQSPVRAQYAAAQGVRARPPQPLPRHTPSACARVAAPLPARGARRRSCGSRR